MTIKTPLSVIKSMANTPYDKMITESQAKLAETKLVPGYTKIYA